MQKIIRSITVLLCVCAFTGCFDRAQVKVLCPIGAQGTEACMTIVWEQSNPLCTDDVCLKTVMYKNASGESNVGNLTDLVFEAGQKVEFLFEGQNARLDDLGAIDFEDCTVETIENDRGVLIKKERTCDIERHLGHRDRLISLPIDERREIKMKLTDSSPISYDTFNLDDSYRFIGQVVSTEVFSDKVFIHCEGEIN